MDASQTQDPLARAKAMVEAATQIAQTTSASYRDAYWMVEQAANWRPTAATPGYIVIRLPRWLFAYRRVTRWVEGLIWE